jgi:hypothetical protein
MRLAITQIFHVKITFAETEIFCPITLSYSSQNLSMFPCAHLSYARNLYSHATEKIKSILRRKKVPKVINNLKKCEAFFITSSSLLVFSFIKINFSSSSAQKTGTFPN